MKMSKRLTCKRNFMRLVVPAFIVAWPIVNPVPSFAQESQKIDYKGLYVYINPLWVNQTSYMENALSKPYIDGAAIVVEWKRLEPAPGQYEFSDMDKWVGAVVAQHKKIDFGVMAGTWSPEWLYDQNHQVSKVSFDYNRNPQGTPNCTVLTLPTPWSPTYINEYNKMMQEVARHFHELKVPGFPQGAAFDALRIVKLTGINNTTEELRLYAGAHPHGDNGACHQTSAPPVWAAAGFTPSKIKMAWTEMSDNTANAFPGKILSVDIIRVNAFPAIDDSGNVYRPEPGANDRLTNEILSIGLSRYKGRFAVQWNALTSEEPDTAVTDAGTKGAIVGWQMNQFMHENGSGCFYGRQRAECKSVEDFQEMFDNGIKRGGQYIEIWAQSVDDFAPAFQNAHNQLVR